MFDYSSNHWIPLVFVPREHYRNLPVTSTKYIIMNRDRIKKSFNKCFVIPYTFNLLNSLPRIESVCQIKLIFHHALNYQISNTV